MNDFHADFPPPPAPEDRHGIGGNRPPVPLTPEQIRTFLTDEHSALIARHDELVGSAAAFLARHPTITTEDVMAAAVENIEMFRKAVAMAEDRRKDAKEPFLEGGRAVDKFFGDIKSSLTAFRDDLSKPALAYTLKLKTEREEAEKARAAVLAREAERVAEQARQAAEAESKLADNLFGAAIAAAKEAEKAEALATTKGTVHSRTTGAYGSTSSAVQSWDVEVIDPALVPDEYWIVNVQALKQAVRGKDGLRSIPGCRVFAVDSLRTR